jgi:hypothetical protein
MLGSKHIIYSMMGTSHAAQLEENNQYWVGIKKL